MSNPTPLPLVTPRSNSVWETGDGTRGHVQVLDPSIVLRGNFRHQGRGATYTLTHADSGAAFRRGFGGDVISGREEAWLSALATVISAHPQGSRPRRIEVAVGDKFTFAGHTWELVDDRALSDPYLVRID